MTADLRQYQHEGVAFTPAQPAWLMRFAMQYPDAPLRVPGLVRGDLDPLNPNSKVCCLGTMLISAFDSMKGEIGRLFRGRKLPPGARLIIDSGGKSIQDTIYLPSIEEAGEIMRFQASVGTSAMTLDAPTAGIEKRINPALRSYDDCLAITLAYVAEYDRLRGVLSNADRVNWLNVVQGRTHAEVMRWYDAVKVYPFSNWAIAGGRRTKYGSAVLPLLLQMLDDRQLDHTKHIHFLGVGSLGAAVAKTAILDALRTVLGRQDLIVTCDDSVSATSSGKQRHLHMGAQLGHNIWRWEWSGMFDHADYAGSTAPFPSIASPLARRVRVGDVCVWDDREHTWDEESRVLLASHAAYVRVVGYIEAARRSRLYKDEAVEFMPEHLAGVRWAVMEILKGGRPGAMLKAWQAQLDDVNRPNLPREPGVSVHLPLRRAKLSVHPGTA